MREALYRPPEVAFSTFDFLSVKEPLKGNFFSLQRGPSRKVIAGRRESPARAC